LVLVNNNDGRDAKFNRMTDLDHYAWHNRYLNDKPVVIQPAKSTTPSPGTIKLNQTPPAKYTTKHLGHTATAVGAVGA